MRGRIVTAVGTVLFLDALRVFLPSLATLFGRAGETSPALMGAYALAWFLVPLPFAALARRLSTVTAAVAAGALLAVGRLLLQAADGGPAQLYVSSAMVGAGAVWLVCTAMASATDGRLTGRGVMVGVVTGVAVSAVVHALLDTVDLVWRTGPVAWGLVAAEVCVFAWLLWRTRRADAGAAVPARPRAWLALGPLLFLSGLYTASPAVAGALGGSPHADAVVATAAVLSVAVAARPRVLTLAPAVPLAVLLAALLALWLMPGGGAPWTPFVWTLAAGQLALAGCAGWAVHAEPPDASAARTGWSAAVGLILFTVLVFAFYASYDLHAPNAYVPFLALVPLALALFPRGAGPGAEPIAREFSVVAAAAVLTLAAVALAPSSTRPAPETGEGLRVAAYNVRMGFGMDGRLSLGEQAEILRELRPDVVVLSEVDRGWLLNGGHDGLDALARELGMTAVWGPSDGPLWGDALLTTLPVIRSSGHTLTPSGPTGAQALEVVFEWEGEPVTVVSTHLQPDDYDFTSESARDQLRDIARVAAEARAGGHPVVVAGDLNVEPDSDAWSILEDAGLRDAFGDVRPFGTIPTGAGEPKEIDHVLYAGDLVPGDPAHPDVPYSDHRPVAVTLVPAG